MRFPCSTINYYNKRRAVPDWMREGRKSERPREKNEEVTMTIDHCDIAVLRSSCTAPHDTN